jgi:hypothetical protein
MTTREERVQATPGGEGKSAGASSRIRMIGVERTCMVSAAFYISHVGPAQLQLEFLSYCTFLLSQRKEKLSS